MVVQNRKYSSYLTFLAVSVLFSICFVFFTGAQGLIGYDLNQVDKAPRIIKRVSPVYPFSFESRGIRAKVKIKCVVDKNGVPIKIVVDDCDLPSALHIFGHPAVEAVKKWRFSPGEIGGQPVLTRVAFWVDFELDE